MGIINICTLYEMPDQPDMIINGFPVQTNKVIAYVNKEAKDTTPQKHEKHGSKLTLNENIRH